jgi:hypothetical protein
MDVRAAEEAEIDQLAQVWYAGWLDAHAQIVPRDLTRVRTLESFRQRLQEALSRVRVVGPSGAPAGFCIIQGDEGLTLTCPGGSIRMRALVLGRQPRTFRG